MSTNDGMDDVNDLNQNKDDVGGVYVKESRDDVTKDIEEIDLDDDVKHMNRQPSVTSPVNWKIVVIVVGVVLLCGIIIAGGIGGYYGTRDSKGEATTVNLSNCNQYHSHSSISSIPLIFIHQ